MLGSAAAAGTAIEPGLHGVHIGHEVQLFVDDALVDNRWGARDPDEDVTRVVHRPLKHPANPVVAGDGGYVSVLRDRDEGLFRMWYQAYWHQSSSPVRYTYATAHAVSEDGIRWTLPRIGRHSFRGTHDNNIVMLGPSGGGAKGQCVLDLPVAHRRGFRFVQLYVSEEPGAEGMHLIGSHDGVTWDAEGDILIAPGFVPDTQSTIVWDPQRGRFVCFTRAVNLYADGDSGPRRRIARMEHDALWSTWPVNAENILIPDEADIARGYGRYYGMPVAYYAGMYWGFLWLYGASEDIYTEITFSRDGRRFHRLAARSPLLDRGPEGAWDHGMIFVSRWVEVGDEWRLYYSGADADHRSWSATTGIGLALMRKEGFASLRSPAGGGVVVTRLLQWPGGGLHVNADARSGELRIGVTGYDRTPFPGLAASDCLPLSGDGVRQQATWRGSDIRALAGQRVRLEFHMAGGVDLYGFRAAPDGAAPQ